MPVCRQPGKKFKGKLFAPLVKLHNVSLINFLIFFTQLFPWNTVFLQKLIFDQLFKKYASCNGCGSKMNQRVNTRPLLGSILSFLNPTHYFKPSRSILILSFIYSYVSQVACFLPFLELGVCASRTHVSPPHRHVRGAL